MFFSWNSLNEKITLVLCGKTNAQSPWIVEILHNHLNRVMIMIRWKNVKTMGDKFKAVFSTTFIRFANKTSEFMVSYIWKDELNGSCSSESYPPSFINQLKKNIKINIFIAHNKVTRKERVFSVFFFSLYALVYIW